MVFWIFMTSDYEAPIKWDLILWCISTLILIAFLHLDKIIVLFYFKNSHLFHLSRTARGVYVCTNSRYSSPLAASVTKIFAEWRRKQSKLKMVRLEIDFCGNTDWLLKWKLKYWAPWNRRESKSLSIFHSDWRRRHAGPFLSAIFSIVMSFVHKCQQNKLQICWCCTFSITLHSLGRSLHFIYSKHISQSNFQASPQQMPKSFETNTAFPRKVVMKGRLDHKDVCEQMSTTLQWWRKGQLNISPTTFHQTRCYYVFLHFLKSGVNSKTCAAKQPPH